ncbi:hypothetical protein MMC24_007967 [Lignoscripta atroalba]|nr:hypothetical protein [Lignoscripta atroalba]
MAPSRPGTTNLLARDIAAYSDAELDKYLEINGRTVRVEDPENLPNHFIQRLRARAGASDTAPSRPIDLNYVAARLGDISTDREASSRPSSPASTILRSDNDEEYCRERLEEETEYYNTLIKEGGRPSHPISLGRDVAKNPGEYREILSFWQTAPNHPDFWEVFGKQMNEWRAFRQRQRYMRDQGRFPEYYQAVKDRLTSYGFDRSFQLDEEPDRQDILTTWIEFLNYEYRTYDKDAKVVKRLQPRYDEAWKKLVDSKLLRSFETEEYVGGYAYVLQVDSEQSQAGMAVEAAELKVQLAEKAFQEARSANLSRDDIYQRKQKVFSARSELAIALKALDTIDRRASMVNDFSRQTASYRRSKYYADRLSILLRWMLQQVSLIELELNPAKVTENDPTGGDGRHRRRLKRNRADDLNEESVSKRQRQDRESHTVPDSKTRASSAQGRFSIKPPRHTRSSVANSDTLRLNPHSSWALHASRASNTKPASEKSGEVVLGDSVRVTKAKRPRKFSSGEKPDFRVNRRSSRPRRPPERFQ